METAILAGGCFWCTEAVFQQLQGVQEVVSGYTGGTIKNPAYREICTGRTGHAEAVKITYDPAIVSFVELLEVFFATHNPTTLNQQGNDKGTQYRSEIFFTTDRQKEEAEQFIALLTEKEIFEDKIVTQISPEHPFYVAEEEHQDYYKDHGTQPYCQIIISPKIKKLHQYFSHKLK